MQTTVANVLCLQLRKARPSLSGHPFEQLKGQLLQHCLNNPRALCGILQYLSMAWMALLIEALQLMAYLRFCANHVRHQELAKLRVSLL